MNIDPFRRLEKIKPAKPVQKSDSVSAPEKGIFEAIMASELEETAPVENPESEMEDLVQLHQQFTASVNHEINNPLFVVRGMAEMLKGADMEGIKKRILADAENIQEEIQAFSRRDVVEVGNGCRQAPLSEIAFRKDLVGCYLQRVIGVLTSSLNRHLSDIEDALNMNKHSETAMDARELDRVKNALKTIKKHADRIKEIVARLDELVPNELEVTQYVEELKMIHLR
jgi:signal transduction histidine kinase